MQNNIKDVVIWGIHANSFKTVKNIYDTCIHYRNLNAQSQNELQELKVKSKEEIQNMQNEITQKNQQIQELTAKLNYMENSKSWKITKPLRKMRGKIK